MAEIHTPSEQKRPVQNPTPWKKDERSHDNEVEESNRQASRSQPRRYSTIAVDQSPDIEPSDSGPEYFGRQ